MSTLVQTLSHLNQAHHKVDVLIVAGLSKPVLSALAQLTQWAKKIVVIEPNEAVWATALSHLSLEVLEYKPAVLAATTHETNYFTFNLPAYDGLHNHSNDVDAPSNLKLASQHSVTPIALDCLLQTYPWMQQAERVALLLDIGQESSNVLAHVSEFFKPKLAWCAVVPQQFDRLNYEGLSIQLSAFLEEPISSKKWFFYEAAGAAMASAADVAQLEAELMYQRDETQLLEAHIQTLEARLAAQGQDMAAQQRQLEQLEAQRDRLTEKLIDAEEAEYQARRAAQTVVEEVPHKGPSAIPASVTQELIKVNAQVDLIKELLFGRTESIK